MIPRYIKNEDDFFEYCPCAFHILNFVNEIKDTDVKWFFERCIYHHDEESFYVLFKSYMTDEFKDYALSVAAEKTESDKYTIRIIKKVDNLLNETD